MGGTVARRRAGSPPAALKARAARADLYPMSDLAALSPTPRVSVVVPCYQHGGHLAEAVESVLAQAGVEVDVTIVDDGSTDSTPDVARALVAAHGGRVSFRYMTEAFVAFTAA
jgi:cellulose synthase/poly-beta-1,6-N-acetylglucosamine synthase-like glycosyltransferase